MSPIDKRKHGKEEEKESMGKKKRKRGREYGKDGDNEYTAIEGGRRSLSEIMVKLGMKNLSETVPNRYKYIATKII
jgi:hypothetical protein